LKPNATPHQAVGRFPGRAAGRSRAWLIILGLALPQLAAAAPLPEPALRLAPAITAPSTNFPADERMLLRVEYQAAQTQATEADILGDILTRVRRVDDMIREIHGLIEVLPRAGLAPAPSPATLPEDDGASSSRTSLALRALMASVIVLLFWLLGKRHLGIKARRRDAAAEAAAAPAPTVIPAPVAADEMAMAKRVTPAKPAGRAVIEAIEPIIEPIAAEDATSTPLPPIQSLSFEHAPPVSVPQPPSPLAPAFEPGTDQALELAEIMVSMGLAHGAAQTLTEYIRDNPKHALHHWLKLLDIYRRSEMKEDFERAAQDLRQCFNIQPEGWAADSGGGHSLEDYPHLAAKLQQLWPTPACAEFLAGLLEDNRGGARHGFPQSVAEEILLLEQMLDTEAAATAA